MEKLPGGIDGVRSAHNGTMAVVPPATGVHPDQVSACRWNGTSWEESRVRANTQVPYFLGDVHPGSAATCRTDQDLTSAWA